MSLAQTLVAKAKEILLVTQKSVKFLPKLNRKPSIISQMGNHQ